jgi:hypothetical protein
MKRMAWIVCLVLAGALASPAARADSDICPVHGVKMGSKTLRVVYGMPSKREFEEMKVAKTRFPFGKDYVLGGCVVQPAHEVKGYVCPKCVAARQEWLASKTAR